MKQKNIIVLCVLALYSVCAGAQESLRLSQSECRRLALEHSETLKKSENALRQAELDRKIANTAYLPKFEASATGAFMLPDMDVMGMKLRMRGAYMAGVALTQPIYAGGKIISGHRLSCIGEDVAAEQLHMTEMDVIAEADNAYWTYIAVERKVQMLESYNIQMDTLYHQLKTSLEAGVSTENDLLRIETKCSEIRYQLQKVRNGAELCRMSLCQIVGVNLDTKLELADTVFSMSLTGPLSGNIESRPELHLLEKQVAAGKEQIRMARADMLPVIGLSLGYDYFGNIKLKGATDAGGGMMIPFTQEFRDGIGLAMLSIKIPIFHWGEGIKKVRKAKYNLQNAELDLQKNTQMMNIQVHQSICNVQDGYELVCTAEKGLEQAEENLRVQQNRFDESMISLTDLLDAQSQWQQAESNLIEAQSQYKIYETEYLRAIGKLKLTD